MDAYQGEEFKFILVLTMEDGKPVKAVYRRSIGAEVAQEIEFLADPKPYEKKVGGGIYMSRLISKPGELILQDIETSSGLPNQTIKILDSGDYSLDFPGIYSAGLCKRQQRLF